MSDRNASNERTAMRLLAVWLLLERSEQALSKSPRTAGDSASVEGGQLAGWPPAPHPCPESRQQSTPLRELAVLLVREFNGKADASDTRRIAELLEFHGKDDWAVSWWERAAAKGDADAQDYLEVLRDDAEGTHLLLVNPPETSRLSEDAAQFVWEASGMTAGTDTATAMQLALKAAACPHPGKDADRLVGEIEEYLRDPDRMTDGRRR
ncbi:hypothetical protein [Streptomyces sp. NPDC004050]